MVTKIYQLGWFWHTRLPIDIAILSLLYLNNVFLILPSGAMLSSMPAVKATDNSTLCPLSSGVKQKILHTVTGNAELKFCRLLFYNVQNGISLSCSDGITPCVNVICNITSKSFHLLFTQGQDSSFLK